MSATQYGILILDVFVGVGVLLVGIGVFIGMLSLSKIERRLKTTLDHVDLQLENVSTPLRSSLAHVDGVTKSLEETAGSLSSTADLAKSAVVPAIVNVGATLSGITAGLRRLVTGIDRKSKE